MYRTVFIHFGVLEGAGFRKYPTPLFLPIEWLKRITKLALLTMLILTSAIAFAS